MASSNIPFRLKWQVSQTGIKGVFRRPGYLTLAVLVAVLVMGVLLWLFNIGLLITIWQSGSITLYDKLLFIPQGYASLFTNFDSPAAASVVLVSTLAGINAALAIYIYRSARKITGSGKGAGAVLAGVIGSGCAVCGTGILGPIFAAFGATISASLSGIIGLVANIAAIALLAYSIFGLSIQAANQTAKEQN